MAPPIHDQRAHHLGRLQQYLDDERISEIMVIRGTEVWVEDTNGIRHATHLSPHDINHALEIVCRAASRRLDLLSPILDAQLPDGSRLCAVIPPIAIDGTTISIRRFASRVPLLSAFGDEDCVTEIHQLIQSRANVVVSGATSSGKTTLLSSAARWFDAHERVVCVEDTSEVRFTHRHVVRLQTRPPTAEHLGEVTLQQLVRTSLRLRPDRLVVGEVRGSEVVDMLLAMSSGHRGCWSTLHAATAASTLSRITSMVLRDAPQWTPPVIAQLLGDAIDAVVHLARDSGGRRRITSIGRVVTTHTDGVISASLQQIYPPPQDHVPKDEIRGEICAMA